MHTGWSVAACCTVLVYTCIRTYISTHLNTNRHKPAGLECIQADQLQHVAQSSVVQPLDWGMECLRESSRRESHPSRASWAASIHACYIYIHANKQARNTRISRDMCTKEASSSALFLYMNQTYRRREGRCGWLWRYDVFVHGWCSSRAVCEAMCVCMYVCM